MPNKIDYFRTLISDAFWPSPSEAAAVKRHRKLTDDLKPTEERAETQQRNPKSILVTHGTLKQTKGWLELEEGFPYFLQVRSMAQPRMQHVYKLCPYCKLGPKILISRAEFYNFLQKQVERVVAA